MKLPASLFEATEATLKNGLQVRIFPYSQTPVVSVYTFYKVGSRNERPGLTGISHLFEHMMFNGAKRYGPGQFDRVLEAHGGYSNAYTSTDHTAYYDDVPAESLETVLDLESDRMASLRISERTLASEREVVKEERRVRVDNDPIGLMDEELHALVFKAHPYHWPVIGWMRDIEQISKDDCQRFFKTHYAPNNALLILVGDLDPDRTMTWVRRYYGDIPRGAAIPPVIDPEPPQLGERRSEIRYPALAPAVMVGFRGPKGDDPDALALDVLQFALSVGEGSRLTRELIHKKRIAISAEMDFGWRIDPGAIVFHLELPPQAKRAVVEQALFDEIDRTAQRRLTQAELERAQNNLTAHLLREMATNNGRAGSLGTYELVLGSWRRGLDLAERYRAIGSAQVQAAAAKYLAPTRRSVVWLAPEGGRS